MEKNDFPFLTIDEAKAYLINKIITQAQKDNVSLSALEVKMLSWTSGKEDPELNRQFDQGHSNKEYEKKISGLISRAYRGNIREKVVFRKVALLLGKGDHYLNVMLEDALGSVGPVGLDNLPPYFILLVILMFGAFLWGLSGMDYIVGNPFAPPENWPEWSRILWWPFVLLSISQLGSLAHISFKVSVRGWIIRENAFLRSIGIKHTVGLQIGILSFGLLQPLLFGYLFIAGVFGWPVMDINLGDNSQVGEYIAGIYGAIFLLYWLIYWNVVSSNQEER